MLPLKRWICLLLGTLTVTSTYAKVPDLWSYWRFQMKKGYHTSLIENLQEFYPADVFDTQKKMVLKAHLYEQLKKPELSAVLFQRYSKLYPILVDYAHYRVLKNRFSKKGSSKSFLTQANQFVENYPNSAFIVAVKHMMVQVLFHKKKGCQKIDALMEEINKSTWALTSEEYQRDQWAQAQCQVQLKEKERATKILRKLWTKTKRDSHLSEVSALLKKLDYKLSTKDIIDRARFLKRLARHREGIELIRKHIPRNECLLECLRLEASLYFFSKQYKNAVSAYQYLYGMLKKPKFLYMTCRSMARSGDINSAVDCYNELDRHKKLTEYLRHIAYYYRAHLLVDEEKFLKAAEYFEKVVRTKRRNNFVKRSLWTLGWIHMHLGQSAKSMKYFEKLSREKLEGIEKGQGHYWMAKSHLKQGNHRKAIGLFDAIRKRSPLSYYGILAQNRLDELEESTSVQVTPQPPPNRQLVYNDDEMSQKIFQNLQSTSTRMYYLQIKELAAIGLMDDARYVLKRLLRENLSKRRRKDLSKRSFGSLLRLAIRDKIFPARLLIQLLLSVQSYYDAVQLAYNQLGYDQTSYPKSDNQWYYWRILYPRPYQAWVEPLGNEYHFSPYILWAIMRSESLFREAIVSVAGAKGLLQIMPHTGKKLAQKLRLKDFDRNQLVIPQINILLSSKYVHDLLYKMDGHLIFTIAAYNAGPHRVRRWMESFQTEELDEFIERVPYVETRKYIMKNLHFLAAYTYLYHPRDSRLRVANRIHMTPNPLLNPEKENWDYELLH